MVAELTTSLQLLQLLSFAIASFLPLGVSGVALDSTSCDGNCIQEMERLIEATPTSYIGGSILYRNERTFITQFFRAICDSYRDVDECLQRCEQRSKQVAELKSAYSGLQFVCKERKEEFFNSLPCLSENESKGVRKCSDQISQSQETTQLFTNSITSREFHSMQMRFSALCRDLSAVIRCLLPVINDSCGDRAANLLLKFIGLEFSSFESLYRQLGFNTPLPVSCRSLIKHAMVSDQGALQKVPSRPPVKFYKFYLNGEMCRPMACWLLITILLLSTIAITLTLLTPALNMQ